jgi:protein-tyrosine kinase
MDTIMLKNSEGAVVLPRAERTVGAILVDAGRLTAEGADRIARLQREKGMRFGEAGLALRVLTRADLNFALSRQFNFPILRKGESAVTEAVVAAYDAESDESESYRILRSQVLARYPEAPASDGKSIAIASPTRGDGRSTVAANLAVVLAQLGASVILVDADMRHPQQHRYFGLPNRVGLSTLLAGRCANEAIQRVPGMVGLSVLTAGASPPNSSELLARDHFSQLVDDLTSRYEYLVYDTPPVMESTDALAVARCARGMVLVGRNGNTRVSLARRGVERLRTAKANVLGAFYIG